MRKTVLTLVLALLPALVRAGETPIIAAAAPEPVRSWTVSLQGGFTNTFQLVLGGTFGQGADWQNRMTVGVNNLWRDGDSLSVFGWSTTDLPTATPNWQAGVTYKNRVLKTRRHTLVLGGSMQRWLLPSVKSGAQDWLVVGNLNYTTTVKKLPLTINSDSWSALRSTLPLGSAVYTQINTQHTLFRRGRLQLVLRHGPHYTYSWGLYGALGNRVLRYGGTLVANWKGTMIEAGCRQQFGLQDGIHYNRFWSILVGRSFNRPFAFWR